MNRELKAVLEVYTRKIRTFIDTQISRINTNLRVAYEHLVSRTSKYPVNYDIADRTIWDSEHLLTALTAFSARKISNGSAPNDGIPDGVSLAHLCLDCSSVLKVCDDNQYGEIRATKIAPFAAMFPNMTDLTLGMKRIVAIGSTRGITNTALKNLTMPYLEYFGNDSSVYTSYFYMELCYGSGIEKANLPSLNHIRFAQYNGYGDRSAMFRDCASLEEIDAPNLTITRASHYDTTSCALAANCVSLKKVRTNIEDAGSSTGGYWGGLLVNCPNIETLIVGKLKYEASSYNLFKDVDGDNQMTKLKDLEIGAGTAVNLNFSRWNPSYSLQNELTTFLQNFRDHIALRLTANGSGKTLTLSQAVYDAVKGTNGGYASIHTLGEICGESLVLTPLEIELGITENTLYSTWLTTYFGENGINWNIETPN